MFFTRYVLTKNSLSLCSRNYRVLCQRVYNAEPKILALNSIRCTSSLPPPPGLTPKQKFQNAIKDYGSTVVVFHVTISLISLGAFYLLVCSGLDLHAFVDFFGITLDDRTLAMAGGTGKFVIAYAIHKAFAPLRISFTLVTVPFLVKYLRRVGVLKNPPKMR